MKYVAVYSYQNKFYPEVWKTFAHKIDKHLRVLVGYPAMRGTRELLFKMTDIFFEKVFKPYMGDEFFETFTTSTGYLWQIAAYDYKYEIIDRIATEIIDKLK